MDRELNKFHLSIPRIIGDTNYWSHDGSTVDVDIADHVQACALYMLYFQAETVIIVSANSQSDTVDVRSRKVYTTPLARVKGKTFFCCYAHGPHCMQSRTVHDIHAHENREQRFPTRPHLPWPQCAVRAYGRYAIEVMINN